MSLRLKIMMYIANTSTLRTATFTLVKMNHSNNIPDSWNMRVEESSVSTVATAKSKALFSCYGCLYVLVLT